MLGLQECFSYSRVSHMPRCVVPVMGSLQDYNKQIFLFGSSIYIPPTAASRDAAFCGEPNFTGVHGAIKHPVPNSALVPQI